VTRFQKIFTSTNLLVFFESLSSLYRSNMVYQGNVSHFAQTGKYPGKT